MGRDTISRDVRREAGRRGRRGRRGDDAPGGGGETMPPRITLASPPGPH